MTFLALLELIRLKQLTAVQPEAFGEIELCRAEPTSTPPAAAENVNAQPSEQAAKSEVQSPKSESGSVAPAAMQECSPTSGGTV